MAFDPKNPPSLIASGIGGSRGLKAWAWKGVDPIATVISTGYIRTARKLGMGVGDAVRYVDGNDDPHHLVLSAIDVDTGWGTVEFPNTAEEAYPIVEDPDGAFYVIAYVDGVQVRVPGTLSVFASQAEAEAGVATLKSMNPLRTKQAIDALQRGIASQTEAEAGSINTKDMTPLRVKQAITVAFVSPVFTGNPAAPTAAPGDNDTSIATTAFVAAAVAPLAPSASPVLTGNPTAPTPSPGDNDTSIATTGFVKAAIDVVLGGVSAAFDTLSEIAAGLALKMSTSVYDPQGKNADAFDRANHTSFASLGSTPGASLPTVAWAIANHHPIVAPDSIRVDGFAAAGDGGGSLYKKVVSQPSHAGKFSITLAGAAVVWYEIADEVMSPAMFASSPTNAAIIAALGVQHARGGGKVLCQPNKIYTGTAAPIVYDYCELDLNGSKVETTYNNAGDLGIRLGNYAELHNGWVHGISNITPNAQYIWHSAISLGAPNQNGDSVASPNPFVFARGWKIHHLKVSATRQYVPAIQGMGGINGGEIHHIEIPDSATCSGIHLDWSDVGGSTVAPGSGVGGAYVSQLERVQAWRNAQNAGTMYTVHPHDISIHDIKCGNLTVATSGDLGSRIVRLSGCHAISIDDCEAGTLTQPAFQHVGGDFGYEFAQSATLRMAYKGTKVHNIRANGCKYHGIFVDTYADNIQAAVALGYSPNTTTIYVGNIEIENVIIYGDNSGAGDGLRVQECKGLSTKNVELALFERGIAVEQEAQKCVFEGGRLWRNRSDGFQIESDSTIKNITARGIWSDLNGTVAANSAGFAVLGGSHHILEDNVAGWVAEDTQSRGFRVTSGTSELTMTGNVVKATKASGIDFLIGNTTDYGILREFKNNRAISGETAYSGANIIPYAYVLGTDGIGRRKCLAARATLTNVDRKPTSGAWVAGETIDYSNPVASSFEGSICVASGSQGTWAYRGATGAGV